MTTLAECLSGWAEGLAARRQVATTLAALTEGAVRVAAMLADGPEQDGEGEEIASQAAGRAGKIMLAALSGTPVAWAALEGVDTPVALQPGAPLAVALEPLDGALNAGTAAPVGTIFSILPTPSVSGSDGTLAFLQRGERQLAAGVVLYGPHTTLALTVREGTHLFVLDRASGTFRLRRRDMRIPEGRRTYAVNAANYRYWTEGVRTYVDDCIAGEDGPRGADFKMRWMGCVAAEVIRILQRGGIYLYPADSRPDHTSGRLRLAFHAQPLALLVEQAGGAASDGVEPLLQTAPRRLQERTPLIFGARDKVARIADYETMKLPLGERSPLFGKRGLFRV